MPRVFASIRVAAPPETVFQMIESPSGPLLPVGGPRLVRIGTEAGTGAIYRWEFRRLGVGFRTDSVVTDYEFGRRIGFHGTAGWTADVTVTLEPEPDGGTKVVFQMQYDFQPPVRWLLTGPLIRAGIWYGLTRLKEMCEEPQKAALPQV